MQCLNCGFENIPGIDTCVRCQSSLSFGDIGVEPPRRRRHLLADLSLALRRWLNRARAPQVPVWATHLQFVLRAIVPGLGQMRINRLLGWGTMAAWTVAAMGAICWMGTAEGGWIFGLMLGIHSLSVMLMMAPLLKGLSLRYRIGAGFAVSLVLYFVLYGGIRYVGGGLLQPMELKGILPGMIRPGDVILYQGRYLKPDRFTRGQVVVYDVRRTYQHGVLIREGMGLDRILAVPGDNVAITGGSILVNDLALSPESMPLLGIVPEIYRLSPQVLPQDTYLIIPSLLTAGGHANGQLPPDLANVLAFVHAEQIQGQVVWRIRPLPRWGPVE